jgi:hypothetical protein
MSSRELPLEATTPVTEAIENVVGEGVRGVTDVSYHAQQVISRATTGGPFAAYVADVSRLGVAVLRAAVSSWSAAIDGLGLIAADQVEWWWTQELTLTFPANQNGQPADVRGVARAEVLSVPHKRKVAERLVRVAHRSAADGTPGFIDRGAGVPADWDRTCYVSVRQHADFIPSAVVVTVTMRDAAGGTLATSEPIDGILSLP